MRTVIAVKVLVLVLHLHFHLHLQWRHLHLHRHRGSRSRPGTRESGVQDQEQEQESSDLSPSELTQVKRGAKRAVSERQTMYEFIDQSLLCFVGFSIAGQVRVIPTCHWRDGDYLYWHGHSKAANIHGVNQTDQPAQEQEKVCITIASLDGLVMARCAFNHSVNYRSAMIYGVPEAVNDPDEKMYHFERFVEKISPGRWEQLRPTTETEARATGIMRIPLDEASMKMRDEGVNDDDADLDWPVWAGVIPAQQVWTGFRQDALQTQSEQQLQAPSLPEGDIKLLNKTLFEKLRG